MMHLILYDSSKSPGEIISEPQRIQLIFHTLPVPVIIRQYLHAYGLGRNLIDVVRPKCLNLRGTTLHIECCETRLSTRTTL